MPFVENRVEFEARHGGNPVYKDGRYLLPDGARYVREFSGFAFAEPPLDPSDRAEAVLTYWEVKLRWAVAEFTKIKEGLMSLAQERARMGWPPPDAYDVAQLERAEKAVKTLQKKVAEAKAVYDQTPRAQAKAKRAQQQAEAVAREQQFLTQLERFKV